MPSLRRWPCSAVPAGFCDASKAGGISAPVARRGRLRRSLFAWCVVALVVAFYLPTLVELPHAWSTRRYASHGVLVPILSVLILWTRRRRLRELAGPGCLAGLLVLGVALGLGAVGYATGSLLPRILSVGLAVSGLALWLRGPAWMRHVAALFPFLLFMQPLPRIVSKTITVQLQHFAASFAAGALDLVGIPVSQAGLVLHLNGGTLRVEEGCNGLAFLMVLLVATVGFALVYLPARRHRLMIIVAAIPIAMLANGVRVLVIAAVAHLIGPEAPIAVLDDYLSKVVWLLAMTTVLGLGVLLGGNADPRPARTAVLASPPGKRATETRGALDASCSLRDYGRGEIPMARMDGGGAGGDVADGGLRLCLGEAEHAGGGDGVRPARL
jgi:exosortase